MKKKTDLHRKTGNKKLALNKQKISELSEGNMGNAIGGKRKTEWCVKTYNIWCFETVKISKCRCESLLIKDCIASIDCGVTREICL